MNNKILPIIALCYFILRVPSLNAQTNVEVFGQNRVQHRVFEWKMYETAHFRIYFYDRTGSELARYVAEQGEMDMEDFILNSGGVITGGKPNVFVYNNYDQFDQTNIGADVVPQLDHHTAGAVNLIGDKLLVYYTGDHEDIKKQLREGLARLWMEKQLFGSDLKNMVKNSLTLQMPKWASDAFVKYVTDGWSPETENEWKDLILREGRHNFTDLTYKYPVLTGMAFWKYISMRYSPKKIMDVLYYSQQKASIDEGVKILSGKKMKEFTDSMFQYYQTLYYSQESKFRQIDEKDHLVSVERPASNVRVSRFIVSPHGHDIAYVRWQYGQYQVIIEKLDSSGTMGKNKIRNVILDGGLLNHNESDDPDYPLLAWDYTGYKLGIIYKAKDKIQIRIYNSLEAKVQNYTINASRFDRITGFSFTGDDDRLVFSAIKRGQGDLFYYRLRKRQIYQITNDIWDEKSPVYMMGGTRRGVAFLSNRPEARLNVPVLPNEMVKGHMNGFFISDRHDSTLVRLTDIKAGNITDLIPFGYDNFAYLNDANGINNRYLVQFARDAHNQDTAYGVPITNYNYSILYQQYNQASEKAVSVIGTPDSFRIYFSKVNIPINGEIIPGIPTTQVDYVDVEGREKEGTSRFLYPLNPALYHTKSRQKQETHYEKITLNDEDVVQRSFEGNGRPKSGNSTTETENGVNGLVAEPDKVPVKGDTLVNGTKRYIYVDSTYIDLRATPGRHIFKPTTVSVSLDNSILFNKYQAYTGTYANPSMGGMITASLLDKPEDHRLTAGLRLPLGSGGQAYYLQYENYRRRLDYTLTYFHSESSQNYQIGFNSGGGLAYQNIYPAKIGMDIAQVGFSYPFNKVSAVRATFAARRDKTVLKAIDPFYQYLGNENKYYATSHLEYVYDDASNPAINIWNGLKWKVYGEYLYKLKDDQIYSSPDYVTTPKTGGFYNFGFEFRYYLPIHKNIILAMRGVGAHSGGNQKVSYMLGGVDNWINSSNADFPAGNTQAYAFQALETNLRGYKQNARNGNNFLLGNLELRVPVFGSLFRTTPRFKLLQNLQMIAFADVGNAWNGFFPKSDDNDRIRTYVWPNATDPNQQIVVHIPYDGGTGTAVGVGAGLRTMLWGYFARLDYAVNRSGNTVWYFSLGYDF